MFCFQCEQTNENKGCTTVGVCGKTPDVAALQDLLIHAAKGVGMYASRTRALGGSTKDIDGFIPHTLFTTLTNVNFDASRFQAYLEEMQATLVRARALYEQACAARGVAPERLSGPAAWQLPASGTLDDYVKAGGAVGVLARRELLGDDIAGLQELVTYGLKGLAAYADHARVLGRQSDDVYGFMYEALDVLGKAQPTVDELLGAALRVGEVNLQVMGMLNEGAVAKYGHPEPTPVRITARKGPAILVSGHDLKDLHDVLEQTAGKGINVYTHGELLPGHAYPELRKFPHLVGNYGGAWQHQKIEFAAFPGPILMTTNCIVEPRRSYKHRIFTRSAVGFPGVQHIEADDFSTLIAAALAEPGFAQDELPEKTILTGFGHNAVLSVADKVLDAIHAGHVRHLFLIGGCDGAEGERSYFRDVALATPSDSLILTLACGKYRFNKLDFGTVAGLPRLLDVGQCNDSYSAVQIAVALATALKTDVNSLPLSFVVSWFEQKAVAVLLTLLHLGIQNIRLGPNLPAFVTPAVLDVLVQKFNIKPTTTAELDMAQMLKEHRGQ